MKKYIKETLENNWDNWDNWDVNIIRRLELCYHNSLRGGVNQRGRGGAKFMVCMGLQISFNLEAWMQNNTSRFPKRDAQSGSITRRRGFQMRRSS